MALFHKDVFLPKFPLPQGKLALTYSNHAKQESESDKYGEVILPDTLDTEKAQVIEVELDNKGVAKIVYRLPMTDRRDISLAVIPGRSLFVKTIWLNPRNDNHRTLNRKRYVGG